MRTEFKTPKEIEDIFLDIAYKTDCVSGPDVSRFKKIMAENIGSVDAYCPAPPVGDGLERRNPLIVVIGDSVTAGHFEFSVPLEELKQRFESGLPMTDVYEIVDVLASYPDRFRRKLIDKYELTSVSVVNSGIAGDTVLGIGKRLDRDVIRYDPHLVIVNATLNWFEECGSNEVFEQALQAIICRLQNETRADIVMLTPNMGLPTPFEHPDSTLDERVNIFRKVTTEKGVTLVDAYKIWEAYHDMGYPLEPLLANGSVHPSETGQEVFAIALMKLFED